MVIKSVRKSDLPDIKGKQFGDYVVIRYYKSAGVWWIALECATCGHIKVVRQCNFHKYKFECKHVWREECERYEKATRNRDGWEI